MTVAIFSFLFILIAVVAVVTNMNRSGRDGGCDHEWQVETRTIFSSKDSGVPIATRTVKVCSKCGACRISDVPIRIK